MTARIVISGLSGGSGKTVLSLGLCRAFADAGLRVKPFKKGPDYIDAAWLGLAARRFCTNLDPFFLSDDRLRDLFGHALHGETDASCGGKMPENGPDASVADIAIIEGNRGLYDGRDAAGTCSTAALARALDAPVILSMNCTKMTRTAAAIAVGLARFEPLRLAGVVLNQIGTSRHAELVRRCMEDAGIRVFGALPRLRQNPIPERHMGLVCGADADASEEILTRLAAFVRENVDVAAVQEAGTLPPVPCAPFWNTPAAEVQVRIGYVHDAALWFYYPENLEALKRAGAELVPVSLLDAAPWPHIDGLYLGGGLPELYAQEIAASPHIRGLQERIDTGLPVYAECGGFMVLCRAMQVHGEAFPMAGVFDTVAVFEPRPQGLGYVEARVEAENPFYPVGTEFRGHEFHYSRCESAGALPTTLRLAGGVGMGEGRDGLCVGTVFAAYTHVFAPAVPHWADSFVRVASRFRTAREVEGRTE